LRVDAAKPANGDQPRSGTGREPIARPLLEGGSKCFLESLLGEVEVAEESDKAREDAARFGKIDLLDFAPSRLGCQLSAAFH